jgi:hypothetical protein
LAELSLWDLLMSWVSDIFLPSTAQSSSDAAANLAKQQSQLNDAIAARQAAADAGDAPPISAQTMSQDQALLQEQVDSQDAAAAAGFAEGAQEGLNNVLNAPGKLVGAVGSGAGTVLWGIVKNIPWWVWAAGVAAVFVWMGGLELLGFELKGRLAKRRA